MEYAAAIKELASLLGDQYDEGESKAIARMVLEAVQQGAHFKPHETMTASDAQVYESYKNALLTGRPVQQVLQHAWFMGLRFSVNKHVLIPRPETEQLADFVIKTYKNLPPTRFLELGIGSGCILVSLAHHLKKGNFTGIDISAEALKVARENATQHKVEIELLALDFLDENNWELFPVPTVLVSNPPYIPAAEAPSLAKHVLDFEPHIALFTPDHQPLIFYEKIAQYAAQKMELGSAIFLEIHTPFAAATEAIFTAQGFAKVSVVKDWFGLDRFLYVTV